MFTICNDKQQFISLKDQRLYCYEYIMSCRSDWSFWLDGVWVLHTLRGSITPLLQNNSDNALLRTFPLMNCGEAVSVWPSRLPWKRLKTGRESIKREERKYNGKSSLWNVPLYYKQQCFEYVVLQSSPGATHIYYNLLTPNAPQQGQTKTNNWPLKLDGWIDGWTDGWTDGRCNFIWIYLLFVSYWNKWQNSWTGC